MDFVFVCFVSSQVMDPPYTGVMIDDVGFVLRFWRMSKTDMAFGAKATTVKAIVTKLSSLVQQCKMPQMDAICCQGVCMKESMISTTQA